MRMSRSFAAVALCAVASCAPARSTSVTSHDSKPWPLAADAVAGITDTTLAAIVGEHWEFMMRWSPTWATTLGDHRYDDVLAPRDAAAIEKMAHERAALIDRLGKIYKDRLQGQDRLTYALLRERLET